MAKLSHLTLRKIGADGTVFRATPFPQAHVGKSFVSSRPIVKQGSVGRVPLTHVIAGQDAVSEAGVKKYLAGAKARRLPVVIKSGANFLIRDGHHRLTADVLRGRKTSKVRIIEQAASLQHRVVEMASALDSQRPTIAAIKARHRPSEQAQRRREIKGRIRNALLGGAFGATLGSVLSKEAYRGGRIGLLIGGTVGALYHPRKRAELSAVQRAVVLFAERRRGDESWWSRNKFRVAGAAVGVAGLAAWQGYRDRGMAAATDRSLIDHALGRPAATPQTDELPLPPPAPTSTSPTRSTKPKAKPGITTPVSPSAMPRPGARKITIVGTKFASYRARLAAGQGPGPSVRAAARKADRPRVEKIVDRLFRGYKRTGDPVWVNSLVGKSAVPLPTIAARGAARASKVAALRKAFKFSAPITRAVVYLNVQDDRQSHRFTPSGRIETIYRKGVRARKYVNRAGGLAQDAADVIAGRKKAPGTKREWEKSWFKNAIQAAVLAGGIYAAPFAYSHVAGRRLNEKVPATVTGVFSHLRSGGLKRMLNASRRTFSAPTTRAVVHLARGRENGLDRGAKTRRVVGATLIGVGAATLPAAIPILRIQGRAAIAGAPAAVKRFLPHDAATRAGRDVADYITGAQRLLNQGATGVAAKGLVKYSRATTQPGTFGRFKADHFARFRSGPREALRHWDWEVGEALSGRGRPTDAFNKGREAVAAAIDRQLHHEGANEIEAIRRVARNPDPQIQSHFRRLMTSKAKVARTYGIKASVAPASALVGAGLYYSGRGRKRGRSEELISRLSSIVALDTQATGAGWDLRDARGRSARVYAPGSRRRDRREKTKWEKVDTIRAVRNVAIAAAVAGAGASAALALRNRQLQKALSPKTAPGWGNIVEFPFKRAR